MSVSSPPADVQRDAFAADVLNGLCHAPRSIPAKYFYDAEGSRLFDRITELDAYYPTRTERAILQDHVAEIARAIGPDAALVEYGSGSSDKTRIVLDATVPAPYRLAAYVPIDISADHLADAADRLRQRYPGLPILPVAADYSTPIELPDLPARTARRVVFFPGSTIGNFATPEAVEFLRRAARTAGPNGLVLLGADQVKDPEILLRAYDDEDGVTAAFNLNLLARMDRELGAAIDRDAWAHDARWNEAEDRIEMHLRSLRDQTIHVGGRAFAFRAGETIHTEDSHKYREDSLARLAGQAGLSRVERWTDARGWFAVELYRIGND